MRNNAREVSCYLSADEAARFREAAASSKVSLSRYLRQCLLDYERITSDLTKPNSFALAETEERLLRRIEAERRRVATVQGHLHLVLAMLDRLAFISLVHLPEVPPDKRETVLASGTRLYENWRRAVAELTESTPETNPRIAEDQDETSEQSFQNEGVANGFGGDSIGETR